MQKKTKYHTFFRALTMIALQLFIILPIHSEAKGVLPEFENGQISPSTKSGTRAIWMYQFPELDNKETIKELLDMGINLVFLSTDSSRLLPSGTNASRAYTQKMRDFINRSHNAGISVHAMTLEDTGFTFSKYHARGAQLVEWIIDFSADSETLEPFDGVHIDTEPHALPSWSDAMANQDWAGMEKTMQQYVQLLATIHDTLRTSPVTLPLSPAIHWKYSEWAADGKVPSADPEILGRYVDFLVPMVYEITGSAKIHSRSLGEATKVPTLVGISAIDFSGYESLKDSIAALGERFKDEDKYMGTSVFKFSTLKALYKANMSLVEDDSESNLPPTDPVEEIVDEAEENESDLVCKRVINSKRNKEKRRVRRRNARRSK